jgi:hypothetical protein
MSNTSRHIAAALAWLIALPIFALALFAFAVLPSSQVYSVLLSLVWSIGLAAIFCSWALRDAPAHGKSRNLALGFTGAWFLVFFLAVIPYLFVTRGAKAGLVAALKFVSLCLGIAIVWLGAPVVVGRLL